RARVKMGPETLIGATAEVVAACRPRGQVRLQGELWQARCEEGADVGERVRVRALEGLTLLVDRAA
ncbi:MAG: NfeD family protein, partial [Gaiellaceae bacterium]